MSTFYEISHKGHTNNNHGNTKQSVIDAINFNYDMIEMDVQLCKSGEIILFHDIYISGQLIYQLTYDEIRSFNPTVVSLKEVLEICYNYNKHVYLDLKGKGPVVYKLIKLLDSININYNKVWIASFNYNHMIDLILLRKEDRDYNIGFITSNNFSFNILYEIKFNLDFIAIDWQIVNKKFIDECHHYNILLFVFTCNNQDELNLIFNKLRPDGIVTNIKIKA